MNNVVGKMLIVMQLVFSILFMCFAGAVYTFQGQWRKQAEAVALKLENTEAQVDDARESRNREIAAKDAEIDRLKTLSDALNAEKAANADKVNSATKLLAAAALERDKAVGDSEVATTEAAARVVEASVLNREVQSLRNRIADMVAEAQALEDERLSLSGKLAEAREKEEQQLAENGKLKDLLRLNNVDPRVVVAGDVPAEQDKIDGFVQGTLKAKTQDQEYIMITVGSDDNILPEMDLIVSRGSKYLGEMRVIKVNPDSAVGILKKETRRGTIQKGDNVTTKL